MGYELFVFLLIVIAVILTLYDVTRKKTRKRESSINMAAGWYISLLQQEKYTPIDALLKSGVLEFENDMDIREFCQRVLIREQKNPLENGTGKKMSDFNGVDLVKFLKALSRKPKEVDTHTFIEDYLRSLKYKD